MKTLLEDPVSRCFQVFLLLLLAVFTLNYIIKTIYEPMLPAYEICELPNGAGFVEWQDGKRDFYPKNPKQGGGIEWHPLEKMRKELEEEG